MINQYSQEMPVTEIPSDQLSHIATCDGWHSADRKEAREELARRRAGEHDLPNFKLRTWCDICTEYNDCEPNDGEPFCEDCWTREFNPDWTRKVMDSDLVFGNDYRQRIHATVAALVISTMALTALATYLVTISARQI